MDLIRRATKAGSNNPPLALPTDEKRGRKNDSRLAFFRRPLRLRGNSTISVPLGIVIFFPMLVLILILILFISHPSSPARFLIPGGAAPSMRKISEKYDKVFVEGCVEPDTSKPRANAAFVILARNKEIDGVIQSIKSVERHFNRWYHYPYVFLNDGDFDDNFKEIVRNHTSGEVEFGKVGPDMWGFPDWIDPAVAQEGIAKQGDAAVMYGGLESYHKMCRFYSGFFFNHPLLLKYEWYWRVEPEISYFCDITYDPFLKMIEANKTYGFTIAVKELRETVPNMFRYASAYKRLNNLTSQGLWEMFVEPPEDQEEEEEPPMDTQSPPSRFPRTSPKKNTKPFIDPESMEGEKYNMCHFWSNFEIAKLSWFRSKEYQDFFQMMDRSGGFWMERWGDAPIHSLAAGALLGPRDIHYFRDFGYRHTTIQHCPSNAPGFQLPRESYLEQTTLNDRARFEEDDYWEHWDAPQEGGVGCRCRCDTDVVDVEGKEGSCLAEWVDVAGGWANT
ncbi:family 15 glycosyltransferase [Dactylonectria macrodidyma]|uniref:Family 15 glycosyltransferase n=1 Tax=Dactylonectria macrodidyma TaxID=307937 RepID=A0A9P9EN47_9HYPO|nr:family 15 glycosyltransferase [Dactylonectria macrodidyma]